MSTEELFQLLMGEPYHLSPREIGDLTPYQVRHVLLRPKKDEGSKPAGMSYEQVFRTRLAAKGLSPGEIDEKWREYQRAEAEKKPEPKARRKGMRP